MLCTSIEEMLMYFYSAIPSSNLDEENIIIDEENVSEKSKEIYLKNLAKFLNKLADLGYKISGSIMSKLLNIIEYDNYQDQILDQYISIITKNIREYNPNYNSIDFDSKKAIEYVNAYINTSEEIVILYDGNKFINISYENEIHEIKDPIPMIVNDMKEWVNLFESSKSTI